MKNRIILLTNIFFVAAIAGALAQEATTPPATSISQGLGLYIFPSEGQTQEQLDADEMEWLNSSYKCNFCVKQ